MSADTTEITLPSGKKAAIRNYTTRRDDAEAEQKLQAGMTVRVSRDGKDEVQISGEATMASERVYVERLVQSIDGIPATSEMLLDLRSSDYEALSAAVSAITKRSLSSGKA